MEDLREHVLYDVVCPVCGEEMPGALFRVAEQPLGSGKLKMVHWGCSTSDEHVQQYGSSVPSYMWKKEIEWWRKRVPGLELQLGKGIDISTPDPPNFHDCTKAKPWTKEEIAEWCDEARAECDMLRRWRTTLRTLAVWMGLPDPEDAPSAIYESIKTKTEQTRANLTAAERKIEAVREWANNDFVGLLDERDELLTILDNTPAPEE